ncbi:MAG: cytochrome c biogenesis protein ResB, partial [Alloprevotella sp.]|nr:cytochrome c biogenesis protein ResB [Alloprevotella sp.]
MGNSIHAKLTTTAGRIVLTVYGILILIMGVATFMQQAHGASYAVQHVYGTAWFCALWGILLLLSLYIITVRARMWKRLPLFLLHLALAIILLGAGVTHFTSREGTLHLRASDSTDRYATADGSVEHLPFTLQLDSFRTICYPGTNTPADFVSHLHDATVSMNRPLRREGYRFYQAGFDPDGQGARLSVTYDPWGTPLTYFGYALLALSMMWVSLRPSTSRHRRQGAKALLLAAFLLPVPAVQARSIPSVSADKAEQAARMPVVWNGRVAPFNTLARDVVQKVYGRTSYKGLRAEQVVLGWAARPEAWKDEPMIRVKDRALRRLLGLTEGNYTTMAALFT